MTTISLKDKIPCHCRPTDEVAERSTDVGRVDQVTRKATKKQMLLSQPDVRRWYDNLSRGSPSTAEDRLRRLSKFCEDHKMTPADIINLAEKDLKTMTDLLEDYVTVMESKGYAPGYIDNHIKAIKSWLRHSDIEIRRKIKIAFRQSTPTLKGEKVPNAEQISEIYSRAKLREAAIISLMAKSGLRPEVLGNHDGSDGLRLGDLPDMVVHDGSIKCLRHPCMIVVRPELSKAGNQYFTFCTKTGTDHITAYLNDRLAHGEAMDANTAMIPPGKGSQKEFLTSQQVSRRVRNTFRPRFSWRPYVLRAYFDTQLLVAESRGKIAHDFRVFFMGHKGSMEARYTTNKGMLPEVLLSEMRQAYIRSQADLDQTEQDETASQKQQVLGAIDGATSEQLGLMLEVLGTGKTDKQGRR